MTDGEYHITYSFVDNSANEFPPGVFGNLAGTTVAETLTTIVAPIKAGPPVQYRTMTTEVYGSSKFRLLNSRMALLLLFLQTLGMGRHKRRSSKLCSF